MAHLLAYPHALVMDLREDHPRSVLNGLLDEKDLNDILSAEYGHLRCMQVVRAYSVAAESDMYSGFRPQYNGYIGGSGARFVTMDAIDRVDKAASEMVLVKETEPAKGYVNHLRVFLGIWLALLPMALIQVSGW